MTLVRPSIWVEIFMENKCFVEIFPRRKPRARSSGGRAGYCQVCWLEAQGKSAQLPQAWGGKQELSLTGLWALKSFYIVCSPLASYGRRKGVEGSRGPAGRRLVLGRVGPCISVHSFAGLGEERDGKIASE